MDNGQRRTLARFRCPAELSIDPKTGFVFRAGWPRPGLRLEPVGGRYTVKVCSFRTGGFTAPITVMVDATDTEVASALTVFAELPVTRTGFAVWRRAVSTALWRQRR